MTRRCSVLLLFLLVLPLILTVAVPKVLAQDALTFTKIDVPNSGETDCNDINTGGIIVGFYVDGFGIQHGFQRTTAGKFAKINYPGSSATLAYGINDKGQVVGWYLDSGGTAHGFKKVGTTFTTIDFPGAIATNLWSINNNGDIVGSYADSGGVFHGMTDIGGTLKSVDYPQSTLSQLTGINNKGQMVGLYLDSAGAQHGFTLANGHFHSVDFPKTGTMVTAIDRINDTGNYVGLYGSSSSGPFLGYTNFAKKFATVKVPGSAETRVRGLNNANQIVGRYTDNLGVIHGYTAK